MKFIIVFQNIVLVKLNQLETRIETRIQGFTRLDSMDQAIARANTSQVQLFQIDYLE